VSAWRVVLAKIACLEELETHWSLGDLLKANAMLDMRDAYEKQAQEEVREDMNKSKNRR